MRLSGSEPKRLLAVSANKAVAVHDHEVGNHRIIKEVCEKYDITADTLRYYERVGVIPAVTRTAGGIRDYQETDIAWVENAICFRDAGMPVEMLIEYVKLFQEGDSSDDDYCEWRCSLLLKEAREAIVEAKKKYDIALEKLDYKIGRYEIAQKTGVLTWDDCKEE